MEETADVGSTSIKMAVAVDWGVGDLIAIASSDFEFNHNEKRTIVDVDKSVPEKPILYLDQPLEYKHYAGMPTFDGNEINMRTEVGLLSRNIVIRGDESSISSKHGATMLIHNQGDNSVITRINQVEFTNVGQAYLVGRYPIHFHMIGSVDKSYVTENSIHESYNRAITLHGVNNLKVHKNVVCNTMGHSIFLQDGVEKFNEISNNLVMGTTKSWSLLNTD